MKKGYWIGNVIEIKNEERWNNYLTKYFQIEEKHKNEQTGNYLPVFVGLSLIHISEPTRR